MPTTNITSTLSNTYLFIYRGCIVTVTQSVMIDFNYLIIDFYLVDARPRSKMLAAFLIYLGLTGIFFMRLKHTISDQSFSDGCTIIACTWQDILTIAISRRVQPWIVCMVLMTAFLQYPEISISAFTQILLQMTCLSQPMCHIIIGLQDYF